MFQFLKPSKKAHPTEVKTMLETKSGYCIDVRTKEEYRNGHIAGSINVPLDNIPQQINRVLKPNDKIVVYCLSGARSKQAYLALTQLGYTDVSDLGSIHGWPYHITK